METSSSHSGRIKRASAVLFIVSGAGYLFSMLKEVLVAANFGIGIGIDAFYASLTIPYFISGITGTLLTGTFTPLFMEYNSVDREKARVFANTVFGMMTLTLLVLMCLVFVFSPQLTALCFPGFQPATAALTVKLSRAACLLVLLTSCVTFASVLLNAEKEFAGPAISNMLITVCTIACVLWLSGSVGIWALMAGVISGNLMQFLVLRNSLKKLNYSVAPAFDSRHPGLIKMRRSGLILLLAVVISHCNLLADRFMISWLPTGSLGAYGYALRLVDVLLQVFCFSTATAAFPFFITDAVGKNHKRLEESFVSGLRMLGFILIPLTVFFVLFSPDIVRVLFQRGAFDGAAARITAFTFSAAVCQVFFVGAVILASRVFFAFNDMKAMLKLNALGLALKVIFNFAFMRVVSPPVAGVALSTAATYLFMILWACFALRRDYLKGMRLSPLLTGLVKITAAALPAAGILAALKYAFVVPAAPLAAVALLAAAGAAGAATYLVCGAALGLEESNSAVSKLLVSVREKAKI
jgi:putative peptidoglycan lipid II flippase